MGWGFNIAFMRYNDPRRRKYRRYMHTGLGVSSADSIKDVLLQRSNVLIQQLSGSPEAFQEHLVNYAGASIMHHTFGFEDWDKYSYLVHDVVKKAVIALSETAFYGARLVFAFPIMAYLPDWFPGAGFKRICKDQLLLTRRFQEEPIDIFKSQMNAGTNGSSWVSHLFEEMKTGTPGLLTEENIKELAANAFTGGFETTSSCISTAVLAMPLHPEAQRRAQDEIDNVVGNQRLPDFSDMDKLPYVSALCREALRWHPPIPLAGHCTSKADTYEAYEIPAGTAVMANIWAMSRDANVFKNPNQFDPDRFINEEGVLDVSASDFVWGFSRRSCPGRTFAEFAIWIAVARILAVYNIEKATDSVGQPVPVKEEFVDHGLFVRPLPFQCSFIPRSKEARWLINEQNT